MGTVLARAFHSSGHDVTVLSRKPANAPWRVVQWDGETIGQWVAEIEGADVVINLAGQSVNCRYTKENRRILIDSRIKSTRVVGQAIAQANHPPRVWLQASTATLYAHRYDAPNDEATGIIGGSEPGAPDTWNFSIDIVTKWEREVSETATPQTRKVLMRSAIVMSPDPGGPFDTLLRLVRFGLGGRSADGKQYISWIHDQDFMRAALWLIQHEELEGPVNLASPNPLPNSEFMRSLREAWGIPFGLPATNGCWSWEHFFSEAKRNSSSKAVGSSRAGCLSPDSPFNFQRGAKLLAISAPDGAKSKKSHLHLVLYDHAGEAFGDSRINRFEFLLLLECFGGVPHHKVANRAVVVIGRIARVERDCFLMKRNGLLCSPGFRKGHCEAVVGKRVLRVAFNQISKHEF